MLINQYQIKIMDRLILVEIDSDRNTNTKFIKYHASNINKNIPQLNLKDTSMYYVIDLEVNEVGDMYYYDKDNKLFSHTNILDDSGNLLPLPAPNQTN